VLGFNLKSSFHKSSKSNSCGAAAGMGCEILHLDSTCLCVVKYAWWLLIGIFVTGYEVGQRGHFSASVWANKVAPSLKNV